MLTGLMTYRIIMSSYLAICLSVGGFAVAFNAATKDSHETFTQIKESQTALALSEQTPTIREP